MTDLKEQFCPIYKEAIVGKPWTNAAGAHRGLLFDKFANAWRADDKTTFAFDKGDKRKKENDQKDNEKVGYWLKGFNNKAVGTLEQLTEACDRQRTLAEAMGGKTLLLTNTSRFVTGMGREHPLENGFTWHHTLGVPYLPGSSVKGLLRAWYRENGTWDEARNKWGVWNSDKRRMLDDETINQVFGSQENGVGQFIVLDMLPVKPPQLVVDIMTPHYGDYYQDKQGQTAPGDWLNPNPITFLAVEGGQSWQLAILPGPSHRSISVEDLNNLQTELLKAFDWLGGGAKTSIGYGRFVLTEALSPADRDSLGALIAKTEPTTTRTFHRGEKVTIKRIDETDKKGKPLFALGDGTKGFFPNETPPNVPIGESVEAWIANTGQKFSFTMKEIKPKKSTKRGRR